MFIDIVAYFKQEALFKSVSLSVRITTWFSVIKQLSSVELASDEIFVLVGFFFLIKAIVWFTKIKAKDCFGNHNPIKVF